jgi:D-arabinose 1-dehydrogenase-like Zn-dependent alcohol dehydrogenase
LKTKEHKYVQRESIRRRQRDIAACLYEEPVRVIKNRRVQPQHVVVEMFWHRYMRPRKLLLGQAPRIARRDPTEYDVQIEILFCGICHSDLHQVRNEWSGVMPTVYPCVPGHEIVGRVTRVGAAVTGFKPGDLAAVGCMVDSDRACPECQAGLEQFCPNMTLTYNFPDKHLGGATYGGYSDSVVVDEHFVLKVPSNLDLA